MNVFVGEPMSEEEKRGRAAAATAAGRAPAPSSGLPKWLLPVGLVVVGGFLFMRGGSQNAKPRG